MLKIGCLHNYLTKDYTTVKSSDNIVISGVEQCMPLRTFLERAEVSSSCSVTMWRVEVSPRPLTMLNVTCHLYEHGGCALWLLILFPLPAALLQCGLTFVGYRVSRSLQDKNKCWRGGGIYWCFECSLLSQHLIEIIKILGCLVFSVPTFSLLGLFVSLFSFFHLLANSLLSCLKCNHIFFYSIYLKTCLTGLLSADSWVVSSPQTFNHGIILQGTLRELSKKHHEHSLAPAAQVYYDFTISAWLLSCGLVSL